jgi:styrene-oxide isomerase
MTTNQHLPGFTMQLTQNIKPIQKTMIGHGLLMMLVGLVTGLLLWVSLLGGFEIYPGFILNINLGGTSEGWARVHRGIPMNSLMVLVFAFVVGSLSFSSKKENVLGWVFIATGWANTVF